jgi:hypothetical protein
MQRFSVTVDETFTRRYEIDAEDEADARRRVEESMSESDEFCPSADSDADYGHKIYDIYRVSRGGKDEDV